MQGYPEVSEEVKAARELKAAARKYVAWYLIDMVGSDVDDAFLRLVAASVNYATVTGLISKRKKKK